MVFPAAVNRAESDCESEATNSPLSTAMMAMTVSNSTKLKPARDRGSNFIPLRIGKEGREGIRLLTVLTLLRVSVVINKLVDLFTLNGGKQQLAQALKLCGDFI